MHLIISVSKDTDLIVIEFVFRPTRLILGKRVASPYWSGRYSLEKGEAARTVALHTPDKTVAQQRLRQIIVEKQREAAGIIAPAAVREAAASPVSQLLEAYESDLTGRELNGQHVHDTLFRLRRMMLEMRWKRVSDIRPDVFVRWRAMLANSATSKRAYQISANSFLNWLVRTEQIDRNPLAKLGLVEIRGKGVRNARSFSPDELERLLSVAERRRLVYLTLIYTGQRKSEVKALIWGDLHLEGNQPYALFREGTMKDKEKRPVPLHPALADALRRMRQAGVLSDKRVFHQVFPDLKTLKRDLERAGIPQKDSVGRVLHFHSFRKTFQTLGVLHGINQRSAQEILGHSDANLTAKAYTDVPALALHNEIGKLPWLGESRKHSHIDAQKPRKRAVSRVRELIFGLIELSQNLELEPLAQSPMVDPTELESVTSSMSRKRSNQLS